LRIRLTLLAQNLYNLLQNEQPSAIKRGKIFAR
jgi:hypothetical protein